MTDPKMQIFFNIADKLMKETNHTFKDVLDLPVEFFGKNKIFIERLENQKSRKTSYKQFNENCYLYADGLKELLSSFKKGSYICYKVTNSPKWVYVFWALIICGFNPILINPIMTQKDTEKIIIESGSIAIISDDNNQYSVSKINFADIKSGLSHYEYEQWGNKVGFCTSGTTGSSRIFIYKDENIVQQVYSAYIMPDRSETCMYNKDLRLISIIPFSHIFGFVAIYLWFTFYGRTIVFPKSNAPEELAATCKEEKVSHIFAVPLFFSKISNLFKNTLVCQSEKKQQLINTMIEYNVGNIAVTEAGFASSKLVRKAVQKKILGSQVKFCVTGGAAISKDVMKTINGLCYPLYNGFGMTEIGVTSVELKDDVKQRLKASVGKQLLNVEYKIDNDELLVKTPQMHSLILKGGKEYPAELDLDGFFHTGDIASMDDEGNVYIKGKKKDIVIAENGENVYPDEIETFFENMPYVINYSVVGVDDELVLVLNIEDGLNDEQINELENKLAEVNDSLPLVMKVKKFMVLNTTVPLNASLKVKKFQLVDDLKNNPKLFSDLKAGKVISFEGFDDKEIENTRCHIRKIFADVLYIDESELGFDQHIVLDLGGDSFSYMSIIGSIECEFKIKLPTELIGRLNTINELSLHILKNKKRD